MMFIGLQQVVSASRVTAQSPCRHSHYLRVHKRPVRYFGSATHIGQTAVVADGNLGLVCVDEDPGMAVRAAASVTRDDARVRPPDGLLVDEIYGGVGSRL